MDCPYYETCRYRREREIELERQKLHQAMEAAGNRPEIRALAAQAMRPDLTPDERQKLAERVEVLLQADPPAGTFVARYLFRDGKMPPLQSESLDILHRMFRHLALI